MPGSRDVSFSGEVAGGRWSVGGYARACALAYAPACQPASLDLIGARQASRVRRPVGSACAVACLGAGGWGTIGRPQRQHTRPVAGCPPVVFGERSRPSLPPRDVSRDTSHGAGAAVLRVAGPLAARLGAALAAGVRLSHRSLGSARPATVAGRPRSVCEVSRDMSRVISSRTASRASRERPPPVEGIAWLQLRAEPSATCRATCRGLD